MNANRKLCSLKLLILVLCLLPTLMDGANILFLLGAGNISHKLGIWPLVHGLAEVGHNITFISSNDVNLKESSHANILDITPESFRRHIKSKKKYDRIKNWKESVKWDLTDSFYDEATIEFCRVSLATYDNDLGYRHILTSVTYDLVIVNTVLNECALYLTHHLRTKFIIYSPMTIIPPFYGAFGLPFEVSSIPEMMQAEFISNPPGLLDRMRNFYGYGIGYSRRESLSRQLQSVVLNSAGLQIQNPPPLVELERQASLVFISTHYSTDFARSLPPLFVAIGGMQCWDEVEALPQDIQEFMDAADAGVVLITFGSTLDLSSLGDTYINMFFNTMRQYANFRFIWRWNGLPPHGAPSNLLSSKWLPQRSILSHPKTKAFMTHGGLNSISEATYAGIPFIVTPLFADQDYNAYRIRAQQLGVVIEGKSFSQQLLDHAFSEVLLNPKYKSNMEVQSKLFKDRPMNPVSEAIWWTEFVLRQDDTTSLKPMLLEQSWWIRSSLDVYFAFLLILGIPPGVVILLTTKLVQKMKSY